MNVPARKRDHFQRAAYRRSRVVTFGVGAVALLLLIAFVRRGSGHAGAGSDAALRDLVQNTAQAPAVPASRFKPWLWMTSGTASSAFLGRSQWDSEEWKTPALLVFNENCPDRARNLIQNREHFDMPFHRSILATIPRSGNHFVRYLLEGATRIQTETMMVEGRTKDWMWRSLGYGGCPLDPKYSCDDKRIHRSAESDSVVVKFHFPFHGPSPIWGENQNHIDSIVTTIRDPYENYMSWLFYKCGNMKDRSMYTFQHYLIEWVDFHLFYRDYARQTCTKLLEVRYEALADDTVRRDSTAEIAKQLYFATNEADVTETARTYKMTVNSPAERLVLAPEVACYAFKREHVEEEPTKWSVFQTNHEDIRPRGSLARMVNDYNLVKLQEAFRHDFHNVCGHFNAEGDLVPSEALTKSLNHEEAAAMEGRGKAKSDYVSCPDLNTAQAKRKSKVKSNPLSVRGKQ